ncbi:MAG: helix-turn-helix domain-containing protein [Magnetococcus sp. DMHC-6]
MSTVGERIRWRRKALGMSQAELGRLSGYGSGQSAIREIEAGRSRRPTNLVNIAAILGVSPEWLSLGEGAMERRSVVKEISLSWSAAEIEEIGEQDVLFRVLNRQPKTTKLGLTPIYSNRMSPILNPGDLVIIASHPQTTEFGNGIYVVRWENKLDIGHLKWLDEKHTLLFWGDHSDFEALQLDSEQLTQFHILGKVIFICRKI